MNALATVDALDDPVDDPNDFTAPSLRALDRSLRCGICSCLFAAPVLLSTCSHTFCSLCLRQHLAIKRRCPNCHVEANEDKIRPVHALEEVVRGWKTARADILSLQTLAAQTSTSALPSRRSPTPSSLTPVPGPSRPPPTAKPDRNGKRKAVKVKSETVEELSIVSSDDELQIQSPPKKRRKDDQGKAKAKGPEKTPKKVEPPSSSAVQCPICAAFVRPNHINPHLDSGCKSGIVSAAVEGSKSAFSALMSSSSKVGGGGKGGKAAPSSESEVEADLDTAKSLPLRSYDYKTVKNLIEMLKEYHLPTTLPSSLSSASTKSEVKVEFLARRHRQFTTFWNANADVSKDSPAHKTAAELRKDLERWEATMEKERKEQAKAEKVGVPSDREIMRVHAEHFRELTEQARASYNKQRELVAASKRAAEEAQEAAAVESIAGEPVALASSPTVAGSAPAARDVDMADAPRPAEEAEATMSIQVNEPSSALPPPSKPRPPSRTVRIVSPRRSPPPAARHEPSSPISRSPSPSTLLSQLSSSPPPPPPARVEIELVDAIFERGRSVEGLNGEYGVVDDEQLEGDEDDEDGRKEWDGKLPRPSQRNREEEQLWARVKESKLAAALEKVDEGEDEDESDEDETSAERFEVAGEASVDS